MMLEDDLSSLSLALFPRVRYLVMVMEIRRLASVGHSRQVAVWRLMRSVRYEGARLFRAL